MLQREPINLPMDIYPPHPWRFVEKQFYPRFLGQLETFGALSNGYLGIRGCFEEGTPVHQSGTFVNDFHETWPIVYPEEAYGFAKTGQTMLKLPESAIIKLYRYQVIKQADLVLAMLLLGNEFSLEQKRRNFEYYDPPQLTNKVLSTDDLVLTECG